MGIAIRADNSTQFDAVPTDVFCHIANNRKACYDINFRFRRESKKSIDVVRMHKDIKPGFLIK
ncbi:Uncharacterised protein [Klebsiella pneumoniae]|uniref:Uncharacterized protein n=1 Tax=Klebsiella pneumoniae TaxID=573 RepID=A0A377W1Q5_KLEPN|nr:hypothetical protein DR88_4501 [Klebsiella pneumoniae]SQC79897.1 Uncharacterised protein [Klebsiella pneumoniae subsp. pneumoniae]KHF68602.1 hypothetical protein LV59_02984 [Klebsiella pneumoniae]STR86163.1 Uncharacterised protein [Klebsiella pneumoniae]STS07302.1 Uncharacterised protein [Klebsiella pneumoniae]